MFTIVTPEPSDPLSKGTEDSIKFATYMRQRPKLELSQSPEPDKYDPRELPQSRYYNAHDDTDVRHNDSYDDDENRKLTEALVSEILDESDDKLKTIIDEVKKQPFAIFDSLVLALNETHGGLDIDKTDFNSKIKTHWTYNRLDFVTRILELSKLTYYDLARYYYDVYLPEHEVDTPLKISLSNDIAQVERMLASIGRTIKFEEIPNFKKSTIYNEKQIIKNIKNKIEKIIADDYTDSATRKTFSDLQAKLGMYTFQNITAPEQEESGNLKKTLKNRKEKLRETLKKRDEGVFGKLNKGGRRRTKTRKRRTTRKKNKRLHL